MKNLLYIFVLSLLFVSCRKEQPPLTHLDCSCAKEVSADFLMEEMTEGNTNFAKYTNTDSIFGDKNVRFRALEENADYTWYIGIEKIKTKGLTRFFPNNMIGQTVPITLVVKKKANKICFPLDDGYDSIVKYITVAKINDMEFLDTVFIEGSYRMKSPLLQDSINIVIDYKNYPSPYYEMIDIYNYDGQGSNCLKTILRGSNPVNYRQFWILDGGTITQGDYLQGDVHINLNGLVEINFTTGKYVNGIYNQQYYDWKYKGRKLQ